MKSKFSNLYFSALIGILVCTVLIACRDASAPGAVNNFSAVPGNAEIVLSWEAPNNDGGSAITAYQISTDDGESWINASGETSHTLTGLRSNADYNISIRAVNSAGEGPVRTQSARTISPYNNVYFVSNGGTEVPTIQNLTHGSRISAPAVPTTNAGGATFNIFRGWYLDNGTFEIAWDFDNDVVNEETTLYADWGYRPGDRGPGTGRIFYRDDAGITIQGYSGARGSFPTYTAYYLEAAPSNSAMSASWGIINVSGDELTTFGFFDHEYANIIGNGRKDTMVIIQHLGPNESGKAAHVAAESSFGSLNDWFLPSLGELKLLYTYRWEASVPSSGWLWSSSQSTQEHAAWSHEFSRGIQGSNTESFPYAVRAIRAF